jgi:ribosomal protein S18 acetylase RimI-like enzyme
MATTPVADLMPWRSAANVPWQFVDDRETAQRGRRVLAGWRPPSRRMLRAMPEVVVRSATRAELPTLAALAGQLVRMHHAEDETRFFLPDRVEAGYEWWLGRELDRAEARVLVAEEAGRVVGYSYGALEERDWNLLLDAHGAVHDLYVSDDARGRGIGKMLLTAMLSELESLGAERVVLSTMVSNETAQRLFRAAGFRPTMLEMTRDTRGR